MDTTFCEPRFYLPTEKKHSKKNEETENSDVILKSDLVTHANQRTIAKDKRNSQVVVEISNKLIFPVIT